MIHMFMFGVYCIVAIWMVMMVVPIIIAIGHAILATIVGIFLKGE